MNLNRIGTLPQHLHLSSPVRISKSQNSTPSKEIGYQFNKKNNPRNIAKMQGMKMGKMKNAKSMSNEPSKPSR